MSPALTGGFFTREPPGKPKNSLLINTRMLNLLVAMKPLHSSAGGQGSVS